MTHNYPIAELLEITSRLLVNATVDGQDFQADLIDCQRKVLKRFLESEQRREIENMMNLKAEDFGFEPHVTGFEESVNLAYLDGARDGEKAGFADGRKAGFAEGISKSKEETAKKLIELGCDDDFIVSVTEFDWDFVRSLRND